MLYLVRELDSLSACNLVIQLDIEKVEPMVDLSVAALVSLTVSLMEQMSV